MHYGRMAIGSDWQRVAEYVRERRTDLGMTQADVQAEGGPATATQRLIEGALRDSYQAAILSRLERALRWKRGSIRAIRNGGEPVVTDAPALRAVPDTELSEAFREIERQQANADDSVLTEDELQILGTFVKMIRTRLAERERQERSRGA
jgi:hypothetical protein